MLNESNIAKAYHWTSVEALASMAYDGRLRMSSAFDGSGEARFSEGKYAYFLSTTQNRNPKDGYAVTMREYHNDIAMLELDMGYLSNKGIFRRVKYHKRGMHGQAGMANRKYESEDRLLSNHASLPFGKAVKSVSIYGEVENGLIERLEKLGMVVKGDYETVEDGDSLYSVGYDHEMLCDSVWILRMLKGDASAEKAMSEIGIGCAGREGGISWSLKTVLLSPEASIVLRQVFVEYMKAGRTLANLINDIEKFL